MVIKVAILDDEIKDSNQVQHYFHQISNHTIQYQCDVYTEVNANFYDNYDLYVLDIEMPEVNGLDIASALREKMPNAILIINSKRNELVFESFKFGAFFFIRKDHFELDMKFAQKRLSEHFVSTKKYYTYTLKQKIQNISYSEIMYIEKVGYSVEIHLNDHRKLIENKSMKKICSEIIDDCFIQCHQSYLVNLNYVKRIDGNDFIINDERIQISRRYLTKVKQAYIQFLSKKM